MPESERLSRSGVGRIDAALDLYSLPREGCPAALAEAMRYSLLAPGKRLRPRMVLLAATACGGNVEAAMPAACAVEMVHAYSLIHDDLPAMDDDDLRRGRPTCHRQFGEALAILAGDALLTLAFEVLAREVRPEALAGRCCLELARAAGSAALVGGQADDLAAETGGGDLRALESIHRRKTGAMFLVSLRLGGLCAGASTEQLTALDAYGKAIGLAFQIVDDLLDAGGGDEQAVGKRLNKDADRGKLTFPRLLGLEDSRRRAGELIAEAVAALQRFGSAAEGLEALAQFVLERNR
ncbi:MAG: polyprenyl synthetase family protein [Pirellulales bacterium]